MPDLLAAPFLGQYLLLRPGSTDGVQLPRGHFDQLAQVAAAGRSYLPWLPGLARQRWGVELPESASMDGRVLVRKESPFGYGRASWEINLGCNYACSHCYLGLKQFSGLPWADTVRLLHMMRDAGVVWLQITGGEPTIDKDFADAYRLAFEHAARKRQKITGTKPDHPDTRTGCRAWALTARFTRDRREKPQISTLISILEQLAGHDHGLDLVGAS